MQFYSINQAVRMLSISLPTIHRRIKSGEVPSVRLGRRILIPADFFKALRDKAVKGAPVRCV